MGERIGRIGRIVPLYRSTKKIISFFAKKQTIIMKIKNHFWGGLFSLCCVNLLAQPQPQAIWRFVNDTNSRQALVHGGQYRMHGHTDSLFIHYLHGAMLFLPFKNEKIKLKKHDYQ
jgi:hypothetical protein